jgi:uncharacterized membrane protein
MFTRLGSAGGQGEAARRTAAAAGWPAIGYIGLGAALMYMLDPDKGRRRRALVRDQLAHGTRKLRNALDATARDLSHRACGVLAESSHLWRHEDVSDEKLLGRVRSKLGRVVSHPHAVTVAVKSGRVTLSGPILASEVDDLLRQVAKISGVREVENQLEVHTRADHIPDLQGGRERPGEMFALWQTNWSPTARLLAGVAGGALVAYGLRRRGLIGASLGTVGAGLLARGLSNLEMKQLIGIGADSGVIHVQKTINIQAPVERVYEFWTNYENFPRFMRNVREVRPTGNSRSHWIVAGPAGIPVEWSAEIKEQIPNRLIRWESVPGSVVKHAGTIQFEANHHGGTRVDIKLAYNPVLGAVGHTLARLLGADPKSEMDGDLMRMKTMIETGHAPHDAANPWPKAPELAAASASAAAK